MLSALFIAGNPDTWRNPYDDSTHAIDKIHAEWEFSELSAALRPASSVGAITINQCAGMAFADIINCILLEKPDVLHLACHASEGQLFLSNDRKEAFAMDEREFGDLVLPLIAPRLIYLNGCNTAAIADKWNARHGKLVLGNEGEINSAVAAKAAAAFYTQIGYGQSIANSVKMANLVMQSYGSSRKLDEASKIRIGGFASGELRVKVDTPLVRLPRLIATAERSDKGYFWVKVGVRNAPLDTTALCFISDDETLPQTVRQAHKFILSVPSPDEMLEVEAKINGSFRFAIVGMTTNAKYAWCLQSSLSRALCENDWDVKIITELAAHGGTPDDIDLMPAIRAMLGMASSMSQR